MRERGTEKPPSDRAGRGGGGGGGGSGGGGDGRGGWDPRYRDQPPPDHRPGPHSDYPPEQVSGYS
jgi:hypothetical protein